ncbi:MAG: beta-lactamase family protein [Rhodococcus sp.]|nr:beta-lactamase family protein [Rhodococcus sp. (in: high G+C Gram-positive bacteria)]
MSITSPPPLSGGSDRPSDQMWIASEFTPLADQFFAMFSSRASGGGALAVYHDGTKVVDIWAGHAGRHRRWQHDTVALSFSTGKGVASTVVHRLAERGVIEYDARVADYWPEFGAAGKHSITVRELLSHRAGLHRIRGVVPTSEQLMDHALVTSLLARSPASRKRLTAPGYHAITFGALVAELAARASGRDFTELVRTEIAEPLGAPELWFVVPREERYRIAGTFPHINPLQLPWGLTSSALSKLPGIRNLADAGMPAGFDALVRNPDLHDSAMPGWNGVFSARSLAKMYAALAGDGSVDGRRLLRPDSVEQLSEVQTTARDYVLGIPMNWRLGYHAGMISARHQPQQAFGHYGLGGSGAFADPESGLAVAFVSNRLGNRVNPIADLRLPRLGATAQALARG